MSRRSIGLVITTLTAIALPTSTASARFTREAPVPAEPQALVITPTSGNDGFDWSDAALGAGGALAIVLLAGGGVVAVRHSRHSDRPSVPAH